MNAAKARLKPIGLRYLLASYITIANFRSVGNTLTLNGLSERSFYRINYIFPLKFSHFLCPYFLKEQFDSISL